MDLSYNLVASSECSGDWSPLYFAPAVFLTDGVAECAEQMAKYQEVSKPAAGALALRCGRSPFLFLDAR
jgi:hypothetical protein